LNTRTSRKHRWLAAVLVAILALTLLCLLVQLIGPQPSHASEARRQATPAPGADEYEPDDPGTGNLPWIGDGETQSRSFAPEGDVDRARLYVKAGHWYEVRTHGLGHLVDTLLQVEVAGTAYLDDDGGDEPLASHVLFQAPADAEATLTLTNAQSVYGPEQTYELTAGEVEAPTPTPTATPRPTQPPPPTPTPAKPLINFTADPDTLQQPGDCATLRWAVDRASEVYLVFPSGSQEGVEGLGERQVCPLVTSEYLLKVNAPGGDETVRVVVTVPLPTPTPAPTARPQSQPNPGATPKGKATLHIVVFVDENYNGIYDPDEGVGGAIVLLRSQTDPAQVLAQRTDDQGQAHFEKTAAGSYAVLIPHAFASLSTGPGRAEAVSFRGEELTVDVLLPALRLPARIP
jgi:hypothetical protein